MKTIAELRDDRSHAIRSAKDIQDRAAAQNRELTAEEQNDVETFLAEAAKLQVTVDTREKQEQLLSTTNDLIAGLSTSNGRKIQQGKPSGGEVPEEPSGIVVNSYSRRFGALRAFTSGEGKTFRDSLSAERAALRCGHWIGATIYGNLASDTWLRKNVGSEWRAAMSEGVNTAGGNLVPDEMAQGIINLREDYGVFRRITKVRPQGSEALMVGRVTGHVTASFTPENTSGTASDMAFNKMQLNAKKLYARTQISSELVEDAIINIADTVANDMAWAFALKEDQCAFIGDGSTTYGGIRGLTHYFNVDAASTGYAGAVNAAVGHDTLAEIDVDDLMLLRAKLPAYVSRVGRPKWICSQAAKALIFDAIKASAGGNDTLSLNGRLVDTFLGDEIVVSQLMPSTTGTINDTIVLAYGDPMLASSLSERRGINIQRNDSVGFNEDQIVLRGTERIDIGWHDLGDATTPGPVVALIGCTS